MSRRNGKNKSTKRGNNMSNENKQARGQTAVVSVADDAGYLPGEQAEATPETKVAESTLDELVLEGTGDESDLVTEDPMQEVFDNTVKFIDLTVDTHVDDETLNVTMGINIEYDTDLLRQEIKRTLINRWLIENNLADTLKNPLEPIEVEDELRSELENAGSKLLHAVQTDKEVNIEAVLGKPKFDEQPEGEPVRKPVYITGLETYSQLMGDSNAPNEETMLAQQRRLYSLILSAVETGDVNTGARIIGEMVAFMAKDDNNAFTLQRLVRGIGRKDCLRNMESSTEFREIVTAMAMIANQKFNNAAFLDMTKLKDNIPTPRAELWARIFKRVAGLDSE